MTEKNSMKKPHSRSKKNLRSPAHPFGLEDKPDIARFQLNISMALHEQVQAVADAEQESFTTILRRFIKLGLMVQKNKEVGGSLVMKYGTTETEIIIL